MPRHFDLQGFLIGMFVLIVSLTVHELAHARAALAAGDDTAKRAGRISLNPIDHMDPMGLLFMIITSLSGFGFGWAKPVPVNPARFKHPRVDNIKVSLWGPLSNFLLAFAAGMLIRYYGQHLVGVDMTFARAFVGINLMLGMFNLLPIAPLDGSHIMSSLLPFEAARRYDLFMMKHGFMILLIMMFTGVTGLIIGLPTEILFDLLTKA